MTGDTADNGTWRRSCGCMRTSEKLKKILKDFPEPPPPSPRIVSALPLGRNPTIVNAAEVSSYPIPAFLLNDITSNNIKMEKQLRSTFDKHNGRNWHIATELMSLIHMAVVGTALVLYYIIYCYMQLIYFTLRSAVYFHHADGPMKLTIAIVTITSIVVAYQVIIRMQKIFFIHHL